MRLQHINLPGLTRYQSVSQIQELLVRQKISHHYASAGVSRTPLLAKLAASPQIITYTSYPTYTSGRRQELEPSQIHALEYPSPSSTHSDAAYVHSPRGGLLTFHGPGQVTAYPILHLRSHGLTVRTYICLLEKSIIRVLGSYGIRGFTRPEYPGVWVSPTEKLASVGVHVQRGVTCFGTGLNVSTDRKWWDRFTACGIDGVNMVGLSDLKVRGLDGPEGVQLVAKLLSSEIADALDGVEGMDELNEDPVKELLQMAGTS